MNLPTDHSRMSFVRVSDWPQWQAMRGGLWRLTRHLGLERLDALRVALAASALARRAWDSNGSAQVHLEIQAGPTPRLLLAVAPLPVAADPAFLTAGEGEGELSEPQDKLLAAAVALAERTSFTRDAQGVRLLLEIALPAPAAVAAEVMEAWLTATPAGHPANTLEPPEAPEAPEAPDDPLDQALLEMAAEVQSLRQAHEELNWELDETNQGVLALYAELEERAAKLRDLNRTLEQRVRERTAEAEQRAEQLRALASKLTQAEHNERRRIAQTLHDHLQQLLVAANMRLSLLGGRVPKGSAADVREIANLIDQSIEASRSLTVELCPAILHDAGLEAAVRWLARRMDDQHRLEVQVTVHGREQALPEELKVLLFQSVQELLFNTVKHGGTSQAQVLMDHRRPGLLQIVVEDQGRGFDPEALSQRVEKGPGFGLFSIRERLEWFGGHFEMASAPGRGTRMTLEAPVGPQERETPAGPARPAGRRFGRAINPGPSKLSSPGITRVLLADDHQMLREGLRRIIDQQPDMAVIGEAANGREAVEMAQRLRPDVVIMDINMPQLNGIQATAIIKDEMPEVNVIGLSMHEQQDVAAALLEVGATAYLNKTSDPETLCDAIRRHTRPQGRG